MIKKKFVLASDGTAGDCPYIMRFGRYWWIRKYLATVGSNINFVRKGAKKWEKEKTQGR